jgi:hypothetical protein|eukprot:COSAG02_NODE_972_length_15544_cov_3.570735_5_plen_92_part_00
MRCRLNSLCCNSCIWQRDLFLCLPPGGTVAKRCTLARSDCRLPRLILLTVSEVEDENRQRGEHPEQHAHETHQSALRLRPQERLDLILRKS